MATSMPIGNTQSSTSTETSGSPHTISNDEVTKKAAVAATDSKDLSVKRVELVGSSATVGTTKDAGGPEVLGRGKEKGVMQKSVIPSQELIASTTPVVTPGTAANASLSNSVAEKGPVAEKASPGNTIIRLGSKKRKKPQEEVSKKTTSSSDKVKFKKVKKTKTTNGNEKVKKKVSPQGGIIATGRWTEQEHDLFKQGLELYGKEWNKVAELVRTRTVVQTRTHAQKYFQRLLKAANIDRNDLRGSREKGKKALKTPSKSNIVNKGLGKGRKKKHENSTSRKGVAGSKSGLKLSPAAAELLSRTSAGFEAMKKTSLKKKRTGYKNSTDEEVMADAKYLELAISGTASSGKKGKRGKGKRKKYKQNSGSNINAPASVDVKKRPRPNLIGLRTPGEKDAFGGYTGNRIAPETPWAGHVAILKKKTLKGEKSLATYDKANKSRGGSGNVFSGIPQYKPSQRSLRRMPAKRTKIHEGILTGDVRGLTAAIRNVKGEIAPSPVASPTAGSSVAASRHADGGSSVTFQLEGTAQMDVKEGNEGTSYRAKKLLESFHENPKMSEIASVDIGLLNSNKSVSNNDENGDKIVKECISQIIDAVERPSVEKLPSSNSEAGPGPADSGTTTTAPPPNLRLNIKSEPHNAPTSKNAKPKIVPVSSPTIKLIRSRPQLNLSRGALDLSVADFVNHPDKYGYTPLILVASLNEAFFKKIKKVNKQDAYTKTPIAMANILFENKASVKYIDKTGYSCLHWAAAKGNTALCMEFLKRGCKINLQGDDGNTPLHLACCEGRIDTVKYLLKRKANVHLRNKWGRNPIELAASEHRVDTMSHRKAADRLRAEIRSAFYEHDGSWRTLLVHHPECQEHEPRKDDEWEHPERIDVIMKDIEEQNFFDCKTSLEYSSDFNRANVKSLLRVHSTQYIKFIHDLSKQVKLDGSVIPFTPKVQKSIAGVSEGEIKEDDICDTSFSTGSLPAARRAVGAVCHAVDRVLSGTNRNAFCAVRPPGHHAGISGLLKNATSCGFCIFNNVAVGALHALDQHNLQRVAILDFDVHHGNGTEEIINKYGDPSKLFFFSVHLYDRNKSYEFYPGTGKDDYLLRNIVNAPMKPLWRRDNSSSSSGRGKRQTRGTLLGFGGRQKFKQIILQKLLPALRAFNPELILLSSGFDGSENDVGNCNHSIGARSGCGLDLRPCDYYWAASKVQEIADICCNGRLVSVLEGGYGQMVRYKLDRKNLAHCVTAHVAALVDNRKMPLFPKKKGESDSESDSSSSDEDRGDDDDSLPDPTYVE